MEAKFTPGPWKQEDCGSLTIVDPTGEYWIAQVKCSRPGDGSGPDWEEALANAALIAAASEMYEALEAMRGEIAALVEDGTLECGAVVVNDGWLKLCAALAKARGEVS